MKAVLCTRLGGPDDLKFADLPDPVPGPGEVVVNVAAAALNFLDTLIIAGKYQTKPPLPFSPAAEFAGTVEIVGDGVASPKAGERVMGYVGWGAARERLAVTPTSSSHCLKNSTSIVPPASASLMGPAFMPCRIARNCAPAKLWPCSARRAAPGWRRWRSAKRWAHA